MPRQRPVRALTDQVVIASARRDSRVLVVQATHAFDEISHRMSFS